MDLQAATTDSTQLFERLWMSVAGAVCTSIVMFLRHWFKREERSQKGKHDWDTSILAQSEKVTSHLEAIIGELRADNTKLRAQLLAEEEEANRWQTSATDARIEVARLQVLLQLSQKSETKGQT